MYHILSEGEERMMVKQWQGVGGELVAELGKKEGHCSDVFQESFWLAIFSGVVLV
jgi:hypothetical protein